MFVPRSSEMYQNSEETLKSLSQTKEESPVITLDASAPASFAKVEPAAPVAVFKLTSDFKADENPKKVNLGVGAFRTEESKPWVLPVVRKAEKIIVDDLDLTKEYLPIAGLESYREAVKIFALGKESKVLKEGRAVGIQSVSGTSALRLAADFLKKYYGNGDGTTPVYVSKPTWPNHLGIFKAAGHTNIIPYEYWDADNLCLDFDKMIEAFKNAPKHSIFIFHCCAHNPTGCDPTKDQWIEIAKVVAENQGFPIFDTAYQGFATGDPEADAWPLRLFAEANFEMFVVSSFSKNFGLYNERIGQLTAITRNSDHNSAIKSQLEILVRTNYSNPPVHGALIVSTILNNPELKKEWLENLNYMSSRIRQMRSLLYNQLNKISTPGKWDHILTQIGMFSYTGLSAEQCDWLKENKSLYLMRSGRINMCAVTSSNVEYIAESIKESFGISNDSSSGDDSGI